MAKRKRLTHPEVGKETSLATKGPTFDSGLGRQAPIARVAGDAAALAAAEKLASEVSSARAEGRLVVELPLNQIEADHILRDRISLNPAEMKSLTESIRKRGQQTPIEVIDKGQGQYGLISGLRRLTAFQALHSETGDNKFAAIKALIKPIEGSAEAYVAMVEENEIRADLSFYERAHIAIEAARAEVFETPQSAIKVLFANATPARRSKIASFVALHEMYGGALNFPEAITEKVGLALVKKGQEDDAFVEGVISSLREQDPETAEAERYVLDAALKPPKNLPSQEKLLSNVFMEVRKGGIVLTGEGVTDEFIQRLRQLFITT